MIVRVYEQYREDGVHRDWCATYDFQSYAFITECKYSILSALKTRTHPLKAIFGPHQCGIVIFGKEMQDILQILLRCRADVNLLKRSHQQVYDTWITAFQEAGSGGCVVID